MGADHPIVEGVVSKGLNKYGYIKSRNISVIRGSQVFQTDIYISPSQIRLYDLNDGDFIEAEIRPPSEHEHMFAVQRVISINGVVQE